MKLDFKEVDEQGNFKIKQFGENYGYDLEAALQKHPIKELLNEQYKTDFMDSLKKGNLQSATFIKGSEEVKQYVEANPQYKSINLYDANLQRLDSRHSQGEKQANGQDQSASNKQDSKKGQAEDESAGGPKERKQRGQRA